MQKLESKTIEQIVSVVISVILLSVFSTFVQSSRAEQEPMPVSIASVEAEIAKKNEEIRLLELKKFSEQKTTLTDEDLARLLHAVGFEGKALRTAWAVVKKESNGRPLAFNGNRRTGDSSYGIFQINMIGGLGVTRRDKFDLNSNVELFDPVVNAQVAYHMSGGGDDWTAWKISGTLTNRDEIRFKEWYAKFPEGVVNE
jgi:hypothetical protein